MGQKKAKSSVVAIIDDDIRTGTALYPSNTKTNQKTGKKKNSSGRIVALTHEKIAQRAHNIWLNHGCIPDRDEQNWHEAETQLKADPASK